MFTQEKCSVGVTSRLVRLLSRANKAMEGSNGSSASWAVGRRVEGLVNKHMADMALETLQQRLSAVSQDMNHLSAEISRREDEKCVEDLPRRIARALPEPYTEELVEEKKLMPNTAPTSSSSSSSGGRRPAGLSELYSREPPLHLTQVNSEQGSVPKSVIHH